MLTDLNFKLFKKPIVQFQDQDIKPAYLRILGISGMIGAPWILIDFIENGLYDRFKSTAASGIHNLLFITGCMCSVLALYYLKATGINKVGRIIIRVQLGLLAIANCWNVYEIISPTSNTQLYYLLSFFWPVSGMFLIVTGIFVIRVRKIKGWRAMLPLLAGFWFPFMALTSLIFHSSLTGLILAGAYAAIVFMAFGFSIATFPDERLQRMAVK